MRFAIHNGVGRSWGEVYNMGFVVYKRVRKGTNFDAEAFQNFGCSRNREGCFPNANMLQTMMHISEPPPAVPPASSQPPPPPPEPPPPLTLKGFCTRLAGWGI